MQGRRRFRIGEHIGILMVFVKEGPVKYTSLKGDLSPNWNPKP